MKKFLVVMVLTLFAAAAAHAEVKMAYVDLNKALNESDAGKAAVKTLEGIIKSKEDEIQKKRAGIKAIEEELAKQSSILNSDALKEKRDKHEKMVKNFQRMVKDSEDELKKKRSDYMQKIIRQIASVVSKIGEEEGYSAIFEKAQSGLMFMPSSSDITDKVIKRFNETSKK